MKKAFKNIDPDILILIPFIIMILAAIKFIIYGN